MRILHASRALIAAVVSSLVTAALLGGAAMAITDTSFRYSEPKTGFLQIPAAGFGPNSSTTEFERGMFSLGIAPTASVDTCFVAPVNLPTGAKMDAVAIWYTKANGSNFSIQLIRQKMADATFVVIFSNSPPDSPTYRVKNWNLMNPWQVVDNQRYNYTLQICMDSTSSGLSGARIAYTYLHAGD